MKERNIFYSQYDNIDWINQEKTKINSVVHDYIISKIFDNIRKDDVRIFDIGFGIGLFLEKLSERLAGCFDKIIIDGCEPSSRNYRYYKSRKIRNKSNINNTFNKTFLETSIDRKYDCVTAVYVFPNIVRDELEKTADKIYSILDNGGFFFLVTASEEYMKSVLDMCSNLIVSKERFEFDGSFYNEILHYTDIPEIGRILDLKRAEKFYQKLFIRCGLDLVLKKYLYDSGFIGTVHMFRK